MAGKAHFVGHHHHGFSLFRQLLHDTQHFAHQFRIQSGRWLIKQQHFRLHRQRAGNRDTLLLAAGEMHRVFRLLTFVNPDLGQVFYRAIARFLFA